MINKLDLGTVVLNWNGMQDTLACLASIYEQQAVPEYVVLVDNGSRDQSVEAVHEWIENHPRFAATEVQPDRESPQQVREFTLRRRENLSGQPTPGVSDFRFVIIKNKSNLGFAAGNNIGLRLLLERGVKYVLLMNNDTLLGEEAFAKLVEGMDRFSCECMVPQIRYADKPDRIWNCGARWTWLGTPRYNYAGANVSALDGVAPFEVEMVTGCALIIRSAWLATHGLLTERFFFGEEDIELSWRMRAMGKGTMLCLPDAVIYHKVGASLIRKTDVGLLPKVYIGYLNRMIFLRSVWGNGYRWQARRILLHTYLSWKLIARMGLTPLAARRVVKDFARDSLKLNGVDADFFSHLMNEKFKAARW